MLDNFILDGRGYGGVADVLLRHNLDPGALRPWIDPQTGKTYITVNNGYNYDPKTGLFKPKYKNLVTNAPTGLPKDTWIQIDTEMIRSAEPELVVWGDLVGAGLTYNVPNAMGTTVIQHSTVSASGNVTMSMDGLREAKRDRPEFDIAQIPLPIIHGDFSFSLRDLAVSQQSGAPLDTVQGQETARAGAELLEDLTLGTASSYSYAGGTIYGLTNHPNRLTKTLTLPTAPGWTPATLVDELLDMFQDLRDIFFRGPYFVYFSPAWTKYLGADYSAAYGGETLRTRLLKIENIDRLRTIDRMTGYQVLIVQKSPQTVQAIQGLPFRTVRWETHGGMQVNFKWLGINVPRVRSNADGNVGVGHGVAA
jgi:hypothetical protein